MKPETVKQLAAINRLFYDRMARPFSDSRPSSQDRFSWIVSQIPQGAHLFDAGCGNASLAERLEGEQRQATYLGMDASWELIRIAASRVHKFRHVSARFMVCDIMRPCWSANQQPSNFTPTLRQTSPVRGPQTADVHRQPTAMERFDIILLLAVLQHIPSIASRLQVLSDLANLMQPQGRLIMTNWQFLNDERMRKKIVSWASAGVVEQDLEPGDTLLNWKRGGFGYRYCHQLTEQEVENLAASSGLRVIHQFLGDGGLNLYSVLGRGRTASCRAPLATTAGPGRCQSSHLPPIQNSPISTSKVQRFSDSVVAT